MLGRFITFAIVLSAALYFMGYRPSDLTQMTDSLAQKNASAISPYGSHD